MSPDVKDVLNFMTMCFDSGKLGFSALNTIRSALSTFIFIDNVPVGSHHMVTRFMKGIFACRPAIPKTIVTWDTTVLLQYLKSLSPVRNLSLKLLTLKAVTLTMLLTGQRCQSLTFMDIRNLSCDKNGIKFRFGDILKQTRPGFQLNELHVKAFAPDRRLCLPTVIMEYLHRVSRLRGETNQLFITISKPHHAAAKQTVSRWIKLTLMMAGIDMSIFTPHSVRSAATSSAQNSKIPLQTILKTAGWSNECTFAKYYSKPLEAKKTFSDALLLKATD